VIGFSDIADGDALWDWNAAAMRDATLIHNDILRELMKKHGGTPASSTDSAAALVAKLSRDALTCCVSFHAGYEAVLTAIGNHGEGSFCVAFQTSIDAVRWATDVQNALLKAEWPEVRVILFHWVRSSSSQPVVTGASQVSSCGGGVGRCERWPSVSWASCTYGLPFWPAQGSSRTCLPLYAIRWYISLT
jgi:hypothetical protein